MVDPFVGAGTVPAVLGAVALVFGAWVQRRRIERGHEEETRRLDLEDRKLRMVERAAFEEPWAVEALARLLSTSSPPVRPANRSSTRAGNGQ